MRCRFGYTRSLLPVVMFLIIQSPLFSNAQEYNDTSQDLLANYCYGYLLSSQDNLQRFCISAEHNPNDKFNQGMLSFCRSSGGKLERLRSYVSGLDFTLNDNDFLRMTLAIRQGKLDFSRCWAEMKSPEFDTCIHRCLSVSRTADNLFQCNQQCSPRICSKGRRCASMDYMPY